MRRLRGGLDYGAACELASRVNEVHVTTRLPPEQRRRQIFEATGRLLMRHGPPGVTMIAVAEEAGLSRRLVYDHFADLATLLREYFFTTLARALTPSTPWAVMPTVSDDSGDVARQIFVTIMGLDAEPRLLIELIRAPKLSDDLALAREVVEQNALARWRQFDGLADLSDALVLSFAKIIIDIALDLAEAVDDGLMTDDDAVAIITAAGKATVDAFRDRFTSSP
jgi:AcrR family transcriptional regulator